jgi:plasmid maintenance system antidote protein VapI
MSLEELLREKMLARRHGSLYKVSMLTGIHHGLLSRFVRGHSTMTLPNAQKLCDLFGLELQERRARGRRGNNSEGSGRATGRALP